MRDRAHPSELSLTLSALDTGNLGDLERFFEDDGGAFANNPFAKRCHCVFHYLDSPAEDWRTRGAGENRALRRSLVAGGHGHGVLAYREGHVVGWVGVDLRPQLPRYDQWQTPRDQSTAIVHCFVVSPALRRRGVATALLGGAVDLCLALDARAVEAYVVTDPASAAASATDIDRMAYHGPLSMYLANGFSVVDDAKFSGFYTRVRRVL